jgi:hypothetical protein
LWWGWEGNWLGIFHYISVVGMGRKLVKDIPLYICGGDGKETG